MIDLMEIRGARAIAQVHNPVGLALLRRLIFSAIISAPFLIGGINGFEIGNVPLWASILVMFGLGQYFILKGTLRQRRNQHLDSGG